MEINRINLEKILPYINDDFILLVPNQRIKDAIISQYLESLPNKACSTPAIFPIDIFVKKQWELNARKLIEPYCNLQLISTREELLIWNEIIETSLQSIPLLNTEETANSASHSYRLAKQWITNEILDKELSINSPIKDTAVFSGWVKDYQNYCQKHQLIGLVDAMLTLTEEGKKNGLAKYLEKFVLVNFFNPPPLYKLFFKALPNFVEVFTNSDGSYGLNLKKTKLEFQSQNSEIKNCAIWAKSILKEYPNAHIGIITTEKSVRPKVELALKNTLAPEQLFTNPANYAPANMASNDKTLFEHALIYDAFLILKLSEDQYYTDDIIRLLQSPYLDLCQDAQEAQENEISTSLSNKLRQQANPTINSREFFNFIKNPDSPFYSKALSSQLVRLRLKIRKIKNLGSPLEWSLLFEDILSEFGWPGRIIDNGENYLVREWQELLKKFSALPSMSPRFSCNIALIKLQLLAKKTLQQNYYDTSLPVSFFSISEAIGLEFDYVWLLGMDDHRWPEPINPSPFLPYSLQNEFNIPNSNSETQLNTALLQFQQLLISTRIAINASYHKNDGNQEFRPSNFLKDFNPEAASKKSDELLSEKAIGQLGSMPIDQVDTEDFALTATENITGGASIISDQSSCPFKAFALNRLKLSPHPAIESGISKTARGTAIHIALETLFEKITSDKALKSISPHQLSEYFTEAAVTAVEFLSKTHRDLLTPRLKNIEQQRICRLLGKFIELEKERPEFKVVAREETLFFKFENLKLTLRIDRIDQLEDGSYALIDYKTGKYSPSPKGWNDDRPEDMQLPLYYYIASKNELQPINAVAIANINIEKTNYTGMASSDKFSEKIKEIDKETWTELSWEQTTNIWVEKITSIASEFNQGECAVNPVNTSTSCTYCGLQALCRIQELTDIQRVTDEDFNS